MLTCALHHPQARAPGAAIRARHRAAPDRDRSASRRPQGILRARPAPPLPSPRRYRARWRFRVRPAADAFRATRRGPRHKWRACASPGTQPCALRPRCAVGSSRRGKHPTSPQPPVSGMRDLPLRRDPRWLRGHAAATASLHCDPKPRGTSARDAVSIWVSAQLGNGSKKAKTSGNTPFGGATPVVCPHAERGDDDV